MRVDDAPLEPPAPAPHPGQHRPPPPPFCYGAPAGLALSFAELRDSLGERVFRLGFVGLKANEPREPPRDFAVRTWDGRSSLAEN